MIRQNQLSMKRWFQYALVLAVMASMAASSQAEICPMKLQGGQGQPCGMSMPAMNLAHRHPSKAASGHDCCPKGATHHRAAQPQCPPFEISACMSSMTCCSLDPQPAQSSNLLAVEQPVVLGIAHQPLLPPSCTSMVHDAPLPSPENPVFRLKEDLRI